MNGASRAWETRRRRAAAGPVQVIENVQARNSAAGGQHIGDLATWNAASVDIPRAVVLELLTREHFGYMATSLEPATALSRAASEVRKADGVMVREFASPNTDTPLALGFYVRTSNGGEAGDGYTCGARCRVDISTGLVVALSPEGDSEIPQAMAAARLVADRANHIVTHAQTVDVSALLIKIVTELSGIPLRNRGGFYLLPPSSCDRWQRVAKLFEPHGIEPVIIEMHDAPSNIAAAQGAVKGSLEAEIATLTADLAKAEEMRSGSLAHRVQVCESLTAKAELYRSVLRDAATGIDEKLAKLRAGFLAAMESPEDDSFTLNDEET